MRSLFALSLCLCVVSVHASYYDMSHITSEQREFIETTEHLKKLVDLAEKDPESLAELISTSPLAAVAQNITVGPFMERNGTDATLPLVVAHGMGDSCFNPGMKSITEASGNHLGVYSTCIPTASSHLMDTIDGFLK